MTVRPNLKTLKAVLVDLSGTLHVEDNATLKAAEGLERCGIRYLQRFYIWDYLEAYCLFQTAEIWFNR